MVKRLESYRILLREPSIVDTFEVFEGYNSDFVLKYNNMEKLDLYGIKNMIERDKGEKVWYLENKETGKFIGAIYCNDDSLRYGMDTIELSYWIDEKFARKGFMSEGMERVIEYLFCEERKSGITVRVFEENIGSRALMKKLGFSQEGVLKNAVKTKAGKVFNDVLYYLGSEDYFEEIGKFLNDENKM